MQLLLLAVLVGAAMALNQKGDRESARKECLTALADKPNKQQEDEIKKLLSRLS